MGTIASNLTASSLVFCIFAVVIQPVIVFFVYKTREKDKAALKVPLVFFSVAYLIVQFFVFFRFLIRIPENFRIISYIVQVLILLVFLVIEIGMLLQNKHVERIDAYDKRRTSLMNEARQEIEIKATLENNPEIKRIIEATAQKIRLADPTGDERTENEEIRIINLIKTLGESQDMESAKNICGEIENLLEVRRIRKR